MEQEQKVWVGGIFFKKHTFSNGGSQIKAWSPNVDELCAWLQANKKADGTIAFNVGGSKVPRMDDKGNEKLNASLDTWEPAGGGQAQQQFGQAPQQPIQTPAPQQGYQQAPQGQSAPPQYQQGVAPQYAPPQTPQG